MTRVLVASDWHLGPRSPPWHGPLARAFLARARAEGATVVLNGDVFDDLFAGQGRAEAAHPAVVEALAALAGEGRLRRTAGNHDPGAGEPRLELSVPGVGRVLVAHGHATDPINSSPVGRLGDAISRRFGRLALVREAARLAEATVRAVAEERMVEVFGARCRALVERERFDQGVLGHVHARHLAPGDRYANAGWLSHRGLEYLELGPAGPRLGLVAPEEAVPDGIKAPNLR